MELLILICLGLIAYQDLRYRAVYWICFPMLGALLFCLKQDSIGVTDSVKDAGIAILFFGTQLLLIWIYFSLKNKKIINLTGQHLGLGDILFLIVLAFYLSPVNYILFYVLSLILVLIYTLLQQFFSKQANPEIPLAGLQALMFGGLFVFSMTCYNFKLTTDAWTYGL